MNKVEKIKELLLAGQTREQIAEACPDLKANSIGVYISKARGLMTPEELAGVKAIKGGASTRKRALAAQQPISKAHRRIGQVLALARTRSELGAKKFSALHGVANHSTLSSWENGFHDFTLTELIKLSKVLKVPIKELISP